jgi:hypothetical protein
MLDRDLTSAYEAGVRRGGQFSRLDGPQDQLQTVAADEKA